MVRVETQVSIGNFSGVLPFSDQCSVDDVFDRCSQVRITLEETFTALADAAGNGRPAPPGSETGVYMGCINYEYTEVLERGGAKARRHCCCLSAWRPI